MKKILLIEDNKDMRENTAEILQLANYHTLTARNGKEGVELAQKEKPKPSNGNGWKPSEHWPPPPPNDGVKLEDASIPGRFLAVSKSGRWIQIQVSH